MTTTRPQPRAARLRIEQVAALSDRLARDFGRLPSGQWDPRHHFLLDALDRGQHHRFHLWPADNPVAVLYIGEGGTAIPAGDPAGADALAPAAERVRWRILIGDEPLASALVDQARAGLLRRRPRAREQRFMVVQPGDIQAEVPTGFRRAVATDVEILTEFACRLHVEDRMGPPLAAPARAGVRSRMAESVRQGHSFVVERQGRPVAKIDLSLYSQRRGAQIAGVYVDATWRRRGLATTAIAGLATHLLGAGLPVVSLHVRHDNVAAVTAYRRAGFRDLGPWLLAVR